MIRRVLLIVSRTAGTGQSGSRAGYLCKTLTDHLEADVHVSLQLVDDHSAARSISHAFLNESDAPALIVAGGGGGTLRAVIEGICNGSKPGQLPGADRVRVTALRMGSGNVLAKEFGVPRDPEEGVKGIAAGIHADRTAPCCVIRCEIEHADREPEIRYAATLGGFGQFGRVPGDLARWHRRLPTIHKLSARLIGIERLTSIEYGFALLARFILSAFCPGMAECIEVRLGERTESLRLLAGAIMNFKLGALPFDPGIRVEQPLLSLNFIPYRGRLAVLGLVLAPKRAAGAALRLEIKRPNRLKILLTDRETAEFFLDEDPMTMRRKLVLQVAGTLTFVPGPLYVPL